MLPCHAFGIRDLISALVTVQNSAKLHYSDYRVALKLGQKCISQQFGLNAYSGSEPLESSFLEHAPATHLKTMVNSV